VLKNFLGSLMRLTYLKVNRLLLAHTYLCKLSLAENTEGQDDQSIVFYRGYGRLSDSRHYSDSSTNKYVFFLLSLVKKYTVCINAKPALAFQHSYLSDCFDFTSQL
jgi:hypothetical protein